MNIKEITMNKYISKKYFIIITIIFLFACITQEIHALSTANIIDLHEIASSQSGYTVAEKPASKPNKRNSIKKKKETDTSPDTSSKTASPAPTHTKQIQMQPLATDTTLTIKVNEKGFFDIKTKQGTWVSGAQVKLTNNPTSASTPSYNTTKTTNNNGEAVFDGVVRSGAYDITISKGGCTSINNRTYIMPNSSTYTHYISLDCGRTPPPVSTSGDSDNMASRLPVKGQLGIEITEFNLNDGAEQAYVNTDITLNYKSSGGVIPSHYKVEECSAFDAPYIQWKTLPSSGYPTFKVPTPRNSTLCFQLKNIKTWSGSYFKQD